MIVIRNIFNLKFGKAKEAKSLLKEGIDIVRKEGMENIRVLTDLTGLSYRVIMETTHKDLADFENSLKSNLSKEEWGKWYQKFVPLVESGEREILSTVDL